MANTKKQDDQEQEQSLVNVWSIKSTLTRCFASVEGIHNQIASLRDVTIDYQKGDDRPQPILESEEDVPSGRSSIANDLERLYEGITRAETELRDLNYILEDN